MSQFDASEYFRKATAAASQDPVLATAAPSAYNELLARKTENNQELASSKLQGAQELNRRKFQADNSWGGDLAPSLEKSLKQTGAELVSGAANAAESAGSFITSLPTLTADAATPDNVRAAYDRVRAGQHTDADTQLLGQVPKNLDPNGYSNLDQRNWFDRVSQAQEGREYASRVDSAFGTEGIVDETSRSNLGDTLSNRYEQVMAERDSGSVGKIFDLISEGGDAILSSPNAVASYIFEEAPELIFGAGSKALLSATNLGYGLTAYRDGLANFEKKNGRSPYASERQELFGWAMASVAAEQVADTAVLGSIKKLLPEADTVNRAVNALDSAAAKVVAKTSSPIAAGAAKTVANAGIEAGTEAFQTFAEGKASYDEATGREIFKAGAIGAGVGGGLSAPGEAAGAVSSIAKEAQAEADASKAERAAKRDTIDKVAETGDASALTDADAETYDPVAAANGLRKRASNEELSPNDRKSATEEVGNIRDTLFNRVDDLELSLAPYTPAGRKKMEQDIARQTTQLADAEEGSARHTQLTAILNATQSIYDSAQAKLTDGSVTEEDVAERQEKLKNYKTMLSDVEQIDASLTTDQDIQNKQAIADAPDLINTVKSSDSSPEKAQAAGDAIITLMMADPTAIAADTINDLLTQEGSQLTSTQRTTLKEFSLAQTAYNEAQSVEGISKRLFAATPETVSNGEFAFKNLVAYREEIANRARTAKKTGNTKPLQNTLNELGNFQTNHANKATALTSAKKVLDSAPEGSTERQYVIPGEDNTWSVSSTLPDGVKHTGNELRKHGILYFSTNSTKQREQLAALINTIGAEVKGITAVLSMGKATQATPEAEVSATAPAAAETVAQVEQPTEEPNNIGEETEASIEDAPAKEVPVAQEAFTKATTIAGKSLSVVAGLLDEVAIKSTNVLGYFRQVAGEASTAKPLAGAEDFLTSLVEQGIDGIEPFLKAVRDDSITDEQLALIETFANKAEEWGAKLDTISKVSPGKFRYRDGTLTRLDPKGKWVTAPNGTHIRNATQQFQMVGGELLTRADDNSAWAPHDGGPLNIVGHNATFWFQNPVMFAFDLQTGTLPSNWKAAISYAVFSWVSESAGGKGNLSKAEIQKIVGKRSDEELTREEWDTFATAGARESLVINDLGARAIQALGLVAGSPNVPANIPEALKQSLGAYAAGLLLQTGMAEHHTIKSNNLFANSVELPEWQITTSALSLANTFAGMKPGTYYDRNQVINSLHTETEGLPIDKAHLTRALKMLDEAILADDPTAERNGRYKVPEGTQQEWVDNLTFVLKARQDPRSEYGVVFFRISRDWNTAREDVRPAKAEANAIYEANQSAKGVLNSLILAEKDATYPSITKPESLQKLAKGTDRTLPKSLQEALTTAAGREYRFRAPMLKALTKLSDDSLARMGGVVADGHVSHVSNEKSAVAKNEAAARQINGLRDFAEYLRNQESGEETPFYYAPDVWKMFRVGLKDKTVNVQTNKLARNFIGMAEHEATFKLTGQAQEDQDKERMYLLAVAQAFGIKADKQSIDTSLAQLNDPALQESLAPAVAAVNQLLADGELTPANETALVAAVDDLGEGYHSFSGLVSYAQYLAARDNADKSFTTDLTLEIDGVTNGLALSQALLGKLSPGNGAMYGFFSATEKDATGKQAKDFPNWIAAPKNFDLYQTIALGIVNATADDASADKLAILHFTRDLMDAEGAVTSAGRNLVKQPSTAIGFGGGLNKIITEDMSAAFVQTIYDTIEKVINSPDSPVKDEELQELYDSLRQLAANTRTGEKVPARAIQSSGAELQESLRTFEFTKAQTKIINSKFDKYIAAPARKSLEGQFTRFIQSRDAYNKAANIAHGLYAAAYESMRKQKIEQLVESGELAAAATAKGARARLDLTQAQEDELKAQLKDLLPLVHTAMSQPTGDLDSAFMIGKTQREYDSKGTSPYAGEITFGQPLPTNAGTGQTQTINRLKYVGGRKVPLSPGVGTLIQLVHSFDSAIAAKVYSKVAETHVHDAGLFSIQNAVEGAKAFNEATFSLMKDYSMGTELNATLNRVFTAFNELAANNDLELDLSGLVDAVRKGADDDLQASEVNEILSRIREFLPKFEKTVAADDAAKYAFLLDTAEVNQYGFEGGSYTVTDADRAALQDKMTKTKGPKATTQLPDSPWGKLGTSKHAVDQGVRSFWQGGETITFQELVPQLRDRIKETVATRSANFETKLLERMVSMIPADLEIVLVTPATPIPSDMGAGIATAIGGYYKGVEGAQIFVKDTMFENSAINTEVLLHELVHAAMSAEVINNPGSPAVKQLEQIQAEALKYIQKNGLDQYLPIVDRDDVQELISWGLTNRGFQRDVLNKINVPLSNEIKASGAFTGMRAFINSLVKAIFSGTSKTVQEVATSGFTSLIAATGTLIGQAEDVGPAVQGTLFQQDPAAQIMKYSMAQTFDALGMSRPLTNTAHVARMKRVLSDVVYGVFGAGGPVSSLAKRKATLTAEEVYAESLRTGKLPFVAETSSEFDLTAQEGFVMESVELAVKEAIKASRVTRKQLERVFIAAREQIKPSDLHRDPVTAQAQYDRIFTVKANADGGTDYLSRFAALGMVYSPLHAKLTTMAPTGVAKGKQANLAQYLKAIITHAMNVLAKLISRSRAEVSIASELESLIVNLTQVHENTKRNLAAGNDSLASLVEEGARALSKKARDKISEASKSALVQESGIKLIRTGANLVGLAADDRFDEFFGFFKGVRDNTFKNTKLGLLAATVNEAIGETDTNTRFFKFLGIANKHDQDRKFLIDQTVAFVNKVFAVEHPLSAEEKAALTKSLVRTDIANLLGVVPDEELQGLLTSPIKLRNKVTQLEQMLQKDHSSDGKDVDYINAAKALGYFMATGKVTHPALMLNVHNIANAVDTGKRVKGIDAAAAAKIIDPLVSLYAYSYLKESDRNTAIAVLKREAARTDGGNGVRNVLHMHRKMQEEALATSFNGNKSQMIKGYTKDILNPHVDVQVADELTGLKLEKAGYVRQGKVSGDPLAPQLDQAIYVRKFGGLKTYTTGSLSLSGMRGRGSALNAGFTAGNRSGLLINNVKETVALTASKRAAIRALSKTFDPSKVKASYMAPVVNEQGQIVNHRFLMSDVAKDAENIYQRDNSIDRVMGVMVGSTYDKANTEVINHGVIDALHTQHRLDRGTLDNAYVEFGPNSADPDIRESYALLPESTKAYIRRKWGSNTMQIRNDLFDMVIGYRSASVVGALEKRMEAQRLGEQISRNIVMDVLTSTKFFTPKVLHRLRVAEDFWQEVVKMTKDNIVIKNVFTLVGNVTSNTTLLLWAGVTPTAIAKHHAVALTGILDYRKARVELFEAEKLLESGVTGVTVKELKQRILILKEDIRTNPVLELVDAGMLQTIVEDIDTSEDQFDYKNVLGDFVARKTKAVPDKLKSVAKAAYLTHDTPVYKVLNQSTQLSDFLARYTLHQHMTTRKNNPLSKDESLRLAMKAFVNYDIPTHKTMQYLNDMGLVFFTKYYIRIQTMLFYLWREAPARGLALAIMNNMFPGIPMILDSAAVTRIGNPLDMGALNYPESVGEIFTINGATSLLGN